MRIDATIQARTRSTRLPNKVMKKIVGKPMLQLQVERLQQSRLIDRIIIATTVLPQDDVIESLADDLGISCFRGSEADVLGRVVGALKAFDVELHFESKGDNPMPFHGLIDSMIGYYLKFADQFDYVTNALKTTYPPGTDTIIYPSEVLIDAEKQIAPDDPLREHVGIHIYQYPDRYRIHNVEAPPWYHVPDLHLEVDTDDDFALVTKIFEHFWDSNPGFSLSQVIEFAQQEQLSKINKGVERRWKKYRQND
jgi:spore coat polysaccharide biosynthesis protein SpsF